MYLSPPSTPAMPQMPARPIDEPPREPLQISVPRTSAPPPPPSPRQRLMTSLFTASNTSSSFRSRPLPALPSRAECDKRSLLYLVPPPPRWAGAANRAEEQDPQCYLFDSYSREAPLELEGHPALPPSFPFDPHLGLSEGAIRACNAASALIFKSDSSIFTRPRPTLTIDDNDVPVVNISEPPYGFPTTIPLAISWALCDVRRALRTTIHSCEQGRPLHISEFEFLLSIEKAPDTLQQLDRVGHFQDLPKTTCANFVFRSANQALDRLSGRISPFLTRVGRSEETDC